MSTLRSAGEPRPAGASEQQQQQQQPSGDEAGQQPQQTSSQQQQMKHRTRKARLHSVPYSQQPGSVAAAAAAIAPAMYTAVCARDASSEDDCVGSSDDDWQAGKTKKRRRSGKALGGRKKQQRQQPDANADAALAAAGDWYAGCAMDCNAYYAAYAAAGYAAGEGQYGEGDVDMAAYGHIVAAAAAAGAAYDPAAVAAAAAAAGLLPEEAAIAAAAAAAAGQVWFDEAEAAAAAEGVAGAAGVGVLTPHLDAFVPDQQQHAQQQQQWVQFARLSQSPPGPGYAGTSKPGSGGKGRAGVRCQLAGSPLRHAAAATAFKHKASRGVGAAAAGSAWVAAAAAALDGHAPAAEDVTPDTPAGTALYEDDVGYAEALQAAEALASLDNSRSRDSTLNAFVSPSNASSRRRKRRGSSVDAAAAEGTQHHMRQPDYSQGTPGVTAGGDRAAAGGRAMQQQQQLQQQKVCQQDEEGIMVGRSMLQQLLQPSNAQQENEQELQLPEGSVGAAGGSVSNKVAQALASVLHSTAAAGAASAAAAAAADSSGALGLLQQAPHINDTSQQHGSAAEALKGHRPPKGTSQQRRKQLQQEAGVTARVLAEPGDSWGANLSPPLPALLQMPQQGSECSLRDVLQERYGSSGALAAAAGGADCTPLDSTCAGVGGGESMQSGPSAAAAAAAVAASVAERRGRRSCLAEAQPGLQQLLATPSAAAVGSVLAHAAAAAAASCAGASGGLAAGEGCGMQGDYVSCFPALTPGGWHVDGSGGNATANRRQQQQQALSEQQQATPNNILLSLGLGPAAGWQQQQQSLLEQQQATPGNIFISTQFGGADGGAYSVLQHLHRLMDSQQRSRGSGNALGTGSSPDSNHQPPQQSTGQKAAAEEQQQQAQRGSQAAAIGSEQGSAGNVGGDHERQQQQQQDESPTSPDELLQPGQQGLGCLLTTPYPLLYRTTNASGVQPEEQQQEAQELQQQQAHAPDSKGSNVTSGAAAAAEGHAGQHGSISGCGYQSAAAAIEDAAQPCAGQVPQAVAKAPGIAAASGGGVDAAVAARVEQCAGGAGGVCPAGKNLNGSSPSSSEPAWTPTVSADARHHS